MPVSLARTSAAVALGLATLAGCAARNPDQLPDFQPLQRQIRDFYRDRAWERNATCLSPEMLSVNEAKVVQETPDQLLLEVRYGFDDFQYGRSGRGFGDTLGGSDCFGGSQRTFVVAKVTGGGYSVVSMSGPQRR